MFLVFTCSQSVVWLPLEEQPEQGLRLRTEEVRHSQFGLEDLRHGHLSVRALKRQLTRQHFVLKKDKNEVNLHCRVH